MSSTPDLIERLALEAGLIDPDLSQPGQMMTDYGNAEQAVRRFAALVAEECAKLADNPAEALRQIQGRAHPADAVGKAIRDKFKEPTNG